MGFPPWASRLAFGTTVPTVPNPSLLPAALSSFPCWPNSASAGTTYWNSQPLSAQSFSMQTCLTAPHIGSMQVTCVGPRVSVHCTHMHLTLHHFLSFPPRHVVRRLHCIHTIICVYITPVLSRMTTTHAYDIGPTHM